MKTISCSSQRSYIFSFSFSFLFHSTKNFHCFSLSILSFWFFSYCCIQKILNKLLQPTAPGLLSPLPLVFILKHFSSDILSVFSLSTLVLLYLCYIFFLQLSILFLSPFIFRSYYLLFLQTIQTIRTVLFSHVLSFNTPHISQTVATTPRQDWLCSPKIIIIITMAFKVTTQ